jgi:predicted XRE-type DNA-binding protein
MEITKFKSVFDSITPNKEESQKMRLRADLMTTLIHEIESWNLKQKEAALKLGIMQPRLNDLLKGKLGNFSLDSLIELSLKSGLEVFIETKRAA